MAGCGGVEGEGEIATATPSPIPVEDLSGEDVLQVKISFEEPTYHKGEDIVMRLEFFNKGDEPFIVFAYLPGHIGFIVTSPSNEKKFPKILYKIRPPTKVIPPTENDFVILKPNENVAFLFTISTFFHFDEVGVYTVQAVYNNSSDHPDGRPAWKGQVYSNTVQFEIVAEAP